MKPDLEIKPTPPADVCEIIANLSTSLDFDHPFVRVNFPYATLIYDLMMAGF